MDLNIFKEKWDKLKNEVQKNWDKFTKEDLKEVEGDMNKLKDLIVEKYDVTADEAEKQIKDFKMTILDTAGKAEDSVDELKDKLEDTVEDVKDEAEDKAKELEGKAKEGIKNLKDKFK